MGILINGAAKCPHILPSSIDCAACCSNRNTVFPKQSTRSSSFFDDDRYYSAATRPATSRPKVPADARELAASEGSVPAEVSVPLVSSAPPDVVVAVTFELLDCVGGAVVCAPSCSNVAAEQKFTPAGRTSSKSAVRPRDLVHFTSQPGSGDGRTYQ
jgi:hypothetical protein